MMLYYYYYYYYYYYDDDDYCHHHYYDYSPPPSPFQSRSNISEMTTKTAVSGSSTASKKLSRAGIAGSAKEEPKVRCGGGGGVGSSSRSNSNFRFCCIQEDEVVSDS